MKYFLKSIFTYIFIIKIYEIIPNKLTPLFLSSKGTMIADPVTNTTIEANVSTNVDILGLESISDYPQVINIRCNNFRKIENENMALLFFLRGSSNYIQTESCILPNEETISSFSCKLSNVLPDGIYNVKSPSNIRYIINFSNNIIVNNGWYNFNQ